MTADTPKPRTCGECRYFDHDAVERENNVATTDWRDHDLFRCHLGALTGKDQRPCAWGRAKMESKV